MNLSVLKYKKDLESHCLSLKSKISDGMIKRLKAKFERNDWLQLQ